MELNDRNGQAVNDTVRILTKIDPGKKNPVYPIERKHEIMLAPIKTTLCRDVGEQVAMRSKIARLLRFHVQTFTFTYQAHCHQFAAATTWFWPWPLEEWGQLFGNVIPQCKKRTWGFWYIPSKWFNPGKSLEVQFEIRLAICPFISRYNLQTF